MSFLDFVKHKDMMNENVQWMNEAFKEKDYNKAKKAILSILKKEITVGNVYYLGVYDLKVDGNFYKNHEWSGPTSRGTNTIPSDWKIVDWV